MTHSLNEIDALAKRAARGAGLSWGMAEEAGRAVRWLAAHDLDGITALADVLQTNDGRPTADTAPIVTTGAWTSQSGQMCPLAAGAAMADLADAFPPERGYDLAGVQHPILIVPFAAMVARHRQHAIKVAYDTVRLVTDGVGLAIMDENGRRDVYEGHVKITFTDTPHSYDPPRQRGRVAADGWARLNTFAQRTYAPATEESRRLGAGAGLADND
ncbi:DUF3726 domain-containing protein [Yoonia sp. 208BN28-4]|uniref:DUF3726 domain-containing protein n=1 Tax=Yoonia sp. 208BN28-4 TaxID=3126505 RepID=UPI0030B6FF63